MAIFTTGAAGLKAVTIPRQRCVQGVLAGGRAFGPLDCENVVLYVRAESPKTQAYLKRGIEKPQEGIQKASVFCFKTEAFWIYFQDG